LEEASEVVTAPSLDDESRKRIKEWYLPSADRKFKRNRECVSSVVYCEIWMNAIRMPVMSTFNLAIVFSNFGNAPQHHDSLW
jgi:hypothetical protein